jgi:hypothetical protein
MTRIVCTADLHEHLVDIPACDLLLIAGDVSFAFKGGLPSKQAFLAGAFKDWLDRVPAEEACWWPATTTRRSRRRAVGVCVRSAAWRRP